jgi:F-type H+-transporting ATPase subunit epsilon
MGFSLEIISLEKKYQRDVKMVILPGIEGNFGVLTGHTRFITAVKPGEIRINCEDFDEYFRVGFGIAEVTSQKVTLITQELINEKYMT